MTMRKRSRLSKEVSDQIENRILGFLVKERERGTPREAYLPLGKVERMLQCQVKARKYTEYPTPEAAKKHLKRIPKKCR